MNIFVLDLDITKCAQYHTDKHVVKMLLESTQLLCNAVDNAPYRKTHLRHPCSLWTQASIRNWIWLRKLVMALNQEWQYRFDHTRDHKSYTVATQLPFPDLPIRTMTPFALAMPEKYRTNDPVVSYRNYYLGEKQHLFKWTKRNIPEWIQTSNLSSFTC